MRRDAVRERVPLLRAVVFFFAAERLAVDFLAGARFAVDFFFAVDRFFAGERLAVDFFLAVDRFFAGERFAVDFFAVERFAVDFFAVDFFLAVDRFFAVDFFAEAFLAVDFFFAPDELRDDRDEERVRAGTVRDDCSSSVCPNPSGPPVDHSVESATDVSVCAVPLQSSWVIYDLLGLSCVARFPTTFAL